ncbi:aldehyde dehydrogenase [Verminephrobacter aporrectodeae subsp. tuberculatae]|uniref:Aldehyde dehydrogenase n=1 Tax=Verminephrobacter aporrectodeae subsp. tuberculatae TaxID=1110392 RepID=A0ABT3KQM3_9BURK|nr:thiamine pyrophosphate-dependent enzyme [Verminephrobacter aporrectodeae]MCW5220444.1 aldehyde dehydrogenase [Verminephrobacter aporrectodeae subsp. tuberculatae]MCW5255601.1 aldehyde dehydrogenase [Verminephrobacter aporrectodeae subsp. tuberculatae]MCW5289740.1 aldehyde dehydrogenase [Verminephrobacter aporrectodeae subsp. tuberculatae]MCW5320618.1 aldehyde dehydrogenase [Verminephrobacter aporrectodeae subsp. tuberculatae]MCW8165954.1 aldehyde dehydrogenase [Verminephrobacter aporrectode
MSNSNQQRADRRAFVAQLLAATPEALVVTGLGSASYDVFAAGDRDKNYYLWGAMGGATGVGLGLALARPDEAVIVITGDGEQLMGIGTLATIGAKLPRNLTIIVLDNGHFGETGMQRSHSSLGTDLVAVAKGFGIADAFTVGSVDACGEIAQGINARQRTAFVQVFIEANEPPRALPPRDGPFIKNRFRAALGLRPF